MTIRDVLLKLKVVSANSFTRTARALPFIGIILAVTGPFVFLTFGSGEANSLPWYIWTITLLLLLLVIASGRYMFMLDSHEAEGISISPKHR